MKDGVLTREHHYNGIFYPKTNSEIISTINKFFHQIDESSKERKIIDIVAKYIKFKKILTFIVPHGFILFFWTRFRSSLLSDKFNRV